MGAFSISIGGKFCKLIGWRETRPLSRVATPYATRPPIRGSSKPEMNHRAWVEARVDTGL